MLFASWCVWSSWLLGILSYVLKRCLILNLGSINVQVRIIWIIMYSLSLRSSPLSIFQDEKLLIWYAGKEEKQLKLSHVSRIIPGQRTVSLFVPSNEMKKISSFFLRGTNCGTSFLFIVFFFCVIYFQDILKWFIYKCISGYHFSVEVLYFWFNLICVFFKTILVLLHASTCICNQLIEP